MKHVITFSRRLNDADARFFFLGQRRDCNVAMMLVSAFNADVSLRALVEGFVPEESVIPRFADYLRRAPMGIAPPVWMPLPEDRQVAEHYAREVELAPGAGWEAVLGIVDEIQSAPFHLDRAPWEVTMVRGAPEGRSVLVVKAHHVLSDGQGFALLFAKTFAADLLAAAGTSIEVETEPPPRGPRLWIALRDRAAALRRWLGRLVISLPELASPERRRRELEAMRRLLRPPRRRPLRSHTRERRLLGFRVPATAWQAEAERRGGNSNELFLALAARIARRALTGSDFDAEPLRIAMPISLRSGWAHDGGNTATVRILELAGSEAELADLSTVRLRASEAKKSAATGPTLFEAALDLLPGPLRAAIEIRQAVACDVLATSIPIPMEGKVPGASVDHMLLVAPAIGQAVSFCLASYRNHFHLAANVDPGIVSDAFQERAEEILEAVFGGRFERFGGVAPAAPAVPERDEEGRANGAFRWERALRRVRVPAPDTEGARSGSKPPSKSH